MYVIHTSTRNQEANASHCTSTLIELHMQTNIVCRLLDIHAATVRQRQMQTLTFASIKRTDVSAIHQTALKITDTAFKMQTTQSTDVDTYCKKVAELLESLQASN